MGYRLADGSRRLAGTAFFLSRPIAGVPDHMFGYFVTAKHVIDGIRAMALDRVLLRVNMKMGTSAWIETALSEWHVHRDANVDVALFAGALPETTEHLAISLASVVRHADLAERQIGVGSEVFITGLFRHHTGQQRNIPIVRVGNLAATPEESIATRMGPMEAYLIEARSIGGLSGSPVFARADPILRMPHGAWGVQDAFWLVGLIHGHFDVTAAEFDDVAIDGVGPNSVNVGIAAVVPADRVLEMLEYPEITEPEEQHAREMRAARSATPD